MAEENEENESTLESVVDTVSAAASKVADKVSDAASTAVDAVKDAVSSDDGASSRPARKVREGTVVSNKMDKTAVVAVVSRVPHAKYNKMILQTTKLHAHDETNDVNIGDKVRVMETRPMSKLKRWRITDVLERAK